MIHVTAAVIEQDGRFLAARRGPDQHLAGYWEFPGGKVEAGESETTCLARELWEEFGVEASIGEKFGENIHHYGEKQIRLMAYHVNSVLGELQPRDHDEIRWLPAEDLMSVEWAPADVPLVHKLRRRAAQDCTRAFYDSNAARYCEDTRAFDLTEEYRRFLEHVPNDGSILDLGCGSGRDAKHFLDLGYAVTALDYSPEIAAVASALIGQDVAVGSYHEMDYQEAFDGIWASASLLHCPREELNSVLERVFIALKPGGTLYVSLKEGDGDQTDENGRFFSLYRKDELARMLEPFTQASDVKIWTSSSKRTGNDQTWLNCLVTRNPR